MTLESIKELMARAPECAITVLGDFCLDKYLYIDPDLDEPSLETGLTAYQVIGQGIYHGGAGTVTNNLRGLTAKVFCVGIVGEDGEQTVRPQVKQAGQQKQKQNVVYKYSKKNTTFKKKK